MKKVLAFCFGHNSGLFVAIYANIKGNYNVFDGWYAGIGIYIEKNVPFCYGNLLLLFMPLIPSTGLTQVILSWEQPLIFLLQFLTILP